MADAPAHGTDGAGPVAAGGTALGGEMYRTVFELSPQAIVLLDKRGRFVAANGRLSDWLGYSADELIGKSLLLAPFMPRASKAVVVRNFLRRMAGKEVPSYELAFTTKSGDTRFGRIHGAVVRDEAGRSLGDIVMISDVTELRAAADDLLSRTSELAERVRELTCLHEISKLAMDASLSLDEFLAGVVRLIPKAWQHPEAASARIRLGDRRFETDGFRETQWMLSSDVVVGGDISGAVDVCYLKDVSDGQGGAFLDEEAALLGTIAERVRERVSRRRTEVALLENEERFRVIASSAQDGIILMDGEGCVSYWNDAASTMFGYSREEALGTNLHSMLAPERYLPSHRTAFTAFQHTGKGAAVGQTLELMALRKDGTEFQVELSMNAVKIKGVWNAVGIVRDISDRKRAERELAESRRKIEGLHGAARTLEGCETRDEVCSVTVRAARDVLGFPVCVAHMAVGDSLVPRSACSELPPGVEMDESTPDESAAMEAFRAGKTVASGDRGGSACSRIPGLFRSCICVPVRGGGVFEALSPDENAFGEEDARLLELLVGHASEALRNMALRDELREQSVRDSLTGLYNRRYLSNIIEQESERARRYGHRIGLLMVDVDNFKKINDTLGHQVGDLVLRQVARFLRAMVRATEFVVRYGGDEFLVVMPESGDDGESVIFRLQRAFGPWSEELPTEDIPVRLSMGFDCWEPSESRSLDDVVASADERMYEDKRLHGSARAAVASGPEP